MEGKKLSVQTKLFEGSDDGKRGKEFPSLILPFWCYNKFMESKRELGEQAQAKNGSLQQEIKHFRSILL